MPHPCHPEHSEGPLVHRAGTCKLSPLSAWNRGPRAPVRRASFPIHGAVRKRAAGLNPALRMPSAVIERDLSGRGPDRTIASMNHGVIAFDTSFGAGVWMLAMEAGQWPAVYADRVVEWYEAARWAHARPAGLLLHYEYA